MKAFSTNTGQNGKANAAPHLNGNTPFFVAQAKLSVGKVDDAYEKEADAVADKVVQRSEKNTFNAAETLFSAFRQSGKCAKES